LSTAGQGWKGSGLRAVHLDLAGQLYRPAKQQ
jgi:hypothetical protein